MILIIITEKKENWLKYIWEQFIEINKFKANYQYLTYLEYENSKYKKNNNYIIEYSTKKQHKESLWILRRNRFKTDQYTWIKRDLPVYSHSLIKFDNKDKYDLFFNAFVHLTRYEEWNCEKQKKYIKSYAYRHPRKEKKIWKIPIVNILFNELEQQIKLKFPEIKFGKKETPIIEASHDVDYIDKTPQLLIKQSFLNFYNAIKDLPYFKFRQSISKMKNGLSFLFRDLHCWCFDEWMEMEKELSVKTVYYIYIKTTFSKYQFNKNWLINPSYDIIHNTKLREKCLELISEGHQIGHHGSMLSAVDGNYFNLEKETLQKLLNTEIIKTRQHWLNYRESKTPYIHNRSGIKEDSTIGFNDTPGFRAGIASEYFPYDHQQERKFQFKEIPLVIMDSHIHNNIDGINDMDIEWFFNSMGDVKKFKVSIDWHQRSISPAYNWAESYRTILERYKAFLAHEYI